MTRMLRLYFLRPAALLGFIIALASPPAHARGIALPPEAAQALTQIYSGDPDAAINAARAIEQSDPQDPLGYAIEAEALWWKIYCASCEVQWGIVDAWKGGKGPDGDAYLMLSEKVVQLANAQMARQDSAEMHLYAGMGWALQSRLYGLRDERRKAARTGVRARSEFIHALRLDPDLADADVGLGLYNYYVDTLSPIVKLLRIFMGIPGGSKQEGVRQLEIGMQRGVLLPVVARFYLAKNLRTYDLHYDQALSIAEPLAVEYPQNPVFLLLVGNLNAELGRHASAADYFRAALKSAGSDPACAARIAQIANDFLSASPY
ncbi:MAG: tetratricopeptide repeat protein [Acidobacteriota bacterium]|nr:tetratricopeptide repeat protein [Acidobacteriota bacterium]